MYLHVGVLVYFILFILCVFMYSVFGAESVYEGGRRRVEWGIRDGR